MPKYSYQGIIIIIVTPSPQSVSSILHIKSLFQAMSHACTLEVCIPYCIKVSRPQLLNALDLQVTIYDVPKVTTISCHHELHKPSSTNTSASTQVSAKRSLQDASALHVVGMPHSLLTTSSKSMVLLHKSVQPLHRLICNSLHVTLANPSAQHFCLGTPLWMPISGTSTSAPHNVPA